MHLSQRREEWHESYWRFALGPRHCGSRQAKRYVRLTPTYRRRYRFRIGYACSLRAQVALARYGLVDPIGILRAHGLNVAPDVTAHVQAWANGQDNYGWVLLPVCSGPNSRWSMFFDSKDTKNASGNITGLGSPRLEVTLSPR